MSGAKLLGKTLLRFAESWSDLLFRRYRRLRHART